MLRRRNRSLLVPKSQTKRLIRVCAGTPHCRAGERRFSLVARRRESLFLPTHVRVSRNQAEEQRRVKMDVLYTNCAGLDVHKKNVKVCLLKQVPNGQPHKEFRTYLTTTEELLKL